MGSSLFPGALQGRQVHAPGCLGIPMSVSMRPADGASDPVPVPSWGLFPEMSAGSPLGAVAKLVGGVGVLFTPLEKYSLKVYASISTTSDGLLRKYQSHYFFRGQIPDFSA